MARKEYEEEHDNPDRWVMPYADLSTLLFALFVVMYSVSSVNEVKYRILTTSVLNAFGQAPPPAAALPIPKPELELAPATSNEPAATLNETVASAVAPENVMLQMSKTLSQNPQPESGAGKGNNAPGAPALPGGDNLISIQPPLPAEPPGGGPSANNAAQQEEEETEQIKQQMDGVANDIRSALASMIKGGSVSVTRSNRGVRIEINASVLFTPGGYKLTEESIRALSATSQILAQKNYTIQVDGYTDNVPIKNSIFPSNWELSAARAGAVVRLFTQNGIADERLTATGHSANDPVQSNETAEGRAKNRRVTVGIMSPHITSPIVMQSPESQNSTINSESPNSGSPAAKPNL
ncbi:OmpA family protein [Candidatus Methylospira mobilis]|uniref:OmpA family protein n=1 Tax=Candidatus Methylospira mobilis TaxID=1808979 RepID=UPI0028F131C6|nr:OmpA family protein [Candidatus Methylospira mobilis]WNV04470.1 OmpA family protein [Candidatus Methylospira mobilis]